MAPLALTAAELLNWLGQFQFLEPAQIADLRPTLAALPDATTLGRELMRRDWLTPYQVNQLLQGKGDQLVLGNYRLKERLAEGAMGQVFKAWTLKLQRIVAIKTIHRELVGSGRAQERFLREMQTTAQLQHPHIIRMLDADDIGDRPFLVMEYIEGTNLSTIVKKGGALPSRDAAEYARQTALGLQHASERGVTHRDIKPSNLLLARAVPGQVPGIKILDFGLARYESEETSAGPRLTQFGKLLGTIDYIAPEQAENARAADVRSDIYSLGCTLYFLLTAHPPFRGADMVEKVLARQKGEPPSVRSECPDVPAGLDAVVRRMMARRPDDRYQTPSEVAAYLAPFTSSTAAAPVAALVPTAAPVARAVPAAAPPVAKPAMPVAYVATPVPPAPAAPHPAAPPPAPAKTGTRSLRLILAVAGLVGLGGIVGVIILAMILSSGPAKPTGSIDIVKAWYSVGDDAMHPGEVKRIFVKIHRTGFKGPVKVAIEEETDSVLADPVTVLPNQDTAELRITVRDTVPAGSQLHVIASAGEISAKTALPLRIEKK